MKTLLKVLFAASLTVTVAGCALLSNFTEIDSGSRRAAKVALTAYADFVQPAILTYGQLPDCSPTAPLVKLCKSHARWVELKGYEAKASLSVAAAGAVLAAGEGDESKITQAISDIEAVQAAYLAAKGN
jgi:hypothetical protein